VESTVKLWGVDELDLLHLCFVLSFWIPSGRLWKIFFD